MRCVAAVDDGPMPAQRDGRFNDVPEGVEGPVAGLCRLHLRPGCSSDAEDITVEVEQALRSFAEVDIRVFPSRA
jgi:hypothetical protein